MNTPEVENRVEKGYERTVKKIFGKMSLSVYQIKPRLVFSSEEEVYKFFDKIGECRLEVEAILSSPMGECFDPDSGYTMKLVEITSSSDFHYVMRVAQGNSLSSDGDYENYYLAGRWLNCFHSSSQNDTRKTAFLFGDYVESHLYIDTTTKHLTAMMMDLKRYQKSLTYINLTQ